MNERYIFRAKTKRTGTWVQGDLSLNNSYGEPLIYAGPDLDYPIDPATLGQSTGLRDKHGTLIFEGDIIRDDYKPTDIFIGVVVWSENLLQWIVRGMGKTGHFPLWEFTDKTDKADRVCKTAEIIGNVHDKQEDEPERMGTE